MTAQNKPSRELTGLTMAVLAVTVSLLTFIVSGHSLGSGMSLLSRELLKKKARICVSDKYSFYNLSQPGLISHWLRSPVLSQAYAAFGSLGSETSFLPLGPRLM